MEIKDRDFAIEELTRLSEWLVGGAIESEQSWFSGWKSMLMDRLCFIGWNIELRKKEVYRFVVKS